MSSTIGANVSGADVSPVYASVVSGTGNALNDPGVNTEITQTEVGSTEFSSRNFSDIGDTGTTAYINNNEGRAFPYKEKNVLDKYRLIGCPCRV